MYVCRVKCDVVFVAYREHDVTNTGLNENCLVTKSWYHKVGSTSYGMR